MHSQSHKESNVVPMVNYVWKCLLFMHMPDNYPQNLKLYNQIAEKAMAKTQQRCLRHQDNVLDTKVTPNHTQRV